MFEQRMMRFSPDKENGDDQHWSVEDSLHQSPVLGQPHHNSQRNLSDRPVDVDQHAAEESL